MAVGLCMALALLEGRELWYMILAMTVVRTMHAEMETTVGVFFDAKQGRLAMPFGC